MWPSFLEIYTFLCPAADNFLDIFNVHHILATVLPSVTQSPYHTFASTKVHSFTCKSSFGDFPETTSEKSSVQCSWQVPACRFRTYNNQPLRYTASDACWGRSLLRCNMPRGCRLGCWCLVGWSHPLCWRKNGFGLYGQRGHTEVLKLRTLKNQEGLLFVLNIEHKFKITASMFSGRIEAIFVCTGCPDRINKVFRRAHVFLFVTQYVVSCEVYSRYYPVIFDLYRGFFSSDIFMLLWTFNFKGNQHTLYHIVMYQERLVRRRAKNDLDILFLSD